MPVLTQAPTPGDLLKHEGNPNHTREVVTLEAGTDYPLGAVLGRITTGAATAAADPGNTGDGTLGPVAVGVRALPGDYRLTCIAAATDAGRFAVVAPDGTRLADLDVGAAYDNGHFAATLADGAADFAVGDTLTVTVAAGSGHYRLSPYTATPGAAGPYLAGAVLIEPVDATAGARDGLAVARGPAIVSRDRLAHDASVDDAAKRAAKAAQLAAAGIVPRDTA